MDGGGGESLEGPEELGTSGKYNGKGGSHTKGVGDFFKGNCAGGTFFWVGEMDDEPLHGTGPGGGFNTR